MAVLPICSVRAGATANLRFFALRRKSAAVPKRFDRDLLKVVVLDLLETLYSTPQGVGLAAPQVGLLMRVVVTDLAEEGRGTQPRVLINPEVEALSDDSEEGFEACLSIPGVRGLVPRAKAVRVRALNERLEPIEFEAVDFEARLMQHEFDHLQGVLYSDRMASGQRLEELPPLHEQLVARAEGTLYG